MNAYRLNDMEWWAGRTVEEAIEVAIRETGVPREDLIDDMYFTGEPESRDKPLTDEGGWPIGKTVGEELDEMTEPGFFAGNEG